MRQIWLTSDHHWGHANFLNFTSSVTGGPVRLFPDVTTMNERMIEVWNENIAPNDIVYHGGDVVYCGYGKKKLAQCAELLDEIMPKLHGHKRLILGNHDDLPMSDYARHFEKIMVTRTFVADGAAVVASHYPLHEDFEPFKHKGKSINVYGHIHERVLDDPRYVNMCVEPNGYRPLNLDDVLKKARGLNPT